MLTIILCNALRTEIVDWTDSIVDQLNFQLVHTIKPLGHWNGSNRPN